MGAITPQQFASALSQVSLTEKQHAVLRAHYEAPHRALTVTMMAKAARYKNYGGINLQYGGLAKRLGDNLGVKTGQKKAHLGFLCDFVEPKALTNSEWILIMRPEFAQGLHLAGLL